MGGKITDKSVLAFFHFCEHVLCDLTTGLMYSASQTLPGA